MLPQFKGWWDKAYLEQLASKFYFKILIGLSGGYFLFGVLGKYSQFWTLNLNAQDFWLFTDILEQGKKGVFFLTRFAPQGLGYVQHGTVHPMLTWGLLTLPAWIFGSIWTALIFNPLVLAGAGWMVGILSRKRWGNFHSLFFAAAFLASTQVGKILNYDVHPEAAYPLLTLIWFWALGLDGAGQVRWIALLVSTLLCMGTKEDSFLVLGPWILWGLFELKANQRKAVLVSGLVALGVVVFQCIAVQNWLSGLWGPRDWSGDLVITNAAVNAFAGGHWTGLRDILQLGARLLAMQGGLGGGLASVGKFLISRPWLSLLVLLPWVVGSLRFWLVVLPLACVYALIEGPNHLWNYYSAPFLGSLWFCGISELSTRFTVPVKLRPLWVLGAALILGNSSIQFFIPSNKVLEIRTQTQKLLPCLGKNGLVASHLIGLVPLEKIWTDRIPITEADWAGIDYVLFSPQLDLFGMSSGEAKKLYDRLSAVGSGFKIEQNCGLGSSEVYLFVKQLASSSK
ncbi:MAG: hypothetical protein ABIQ95_14285 [Bdellovibrionia bacterium]